MATYMTRMPGWIVSLMFVSLLRRSTSNVAIRSAMSSSPVSSCMVRALSSGMVMKTAVSTFGLPSRYLSKAISVMLSPFCQLTNLNGPVPEGFFLISAFASISVGSMTSPAVWHIVWMNGPNDWLRTNCTVWGSTTLTSERMGLKSEVRL